MWRRGGGTGGLDVNGFRCVGLGSESAAKDLNFWNENHDREPAIQFWWPGM